LLPLALPDDGLLLNELLARKLGVKAGDSVRVEVLEGARPVREVRVAALSQQYMGMGVYLRQAALNRLLREGPAISSALLAIDDRQADSIYQRLREMPGVAAVNLRHTLIESFNETLQRVLLTFTLINAVLGAVIAFGVVYNTVRMALAERSRELASLRVLEAGRQGVWLDMGLAEAVFMPRAEQQKRLEPGWRCVAMLIEDERLGLIATARLNDFLDDEAEGLNPGDAVSLLVAARTDMGWKVVVNHRFWGLLYADEVFESLLIGDRRNGFVKRLRGDRRLDVSLAPPGYAKVDGAADKVLAALRASGGFLPLGDDSSPDEIHAAFGISKKVFKQAIGALFRQQRIVIGEQGIRLVQG